MFAAPSASCCCASVVIIGFNSFFLFLFAFPLEAVFATCFAFWIAACFIWEPFILWWCCCGGLVGWWVGVCEEVGRQEGFSCMTRVSAPYCAVLTRAGLPWPPPQRGKAGGRVVRGWSSKASKDDGRKVASCRCDYDYDHDHGYARSARFI